MSRKPKNDERFRVLVVDDHASAREAVADVLRQAEYDVATCASATEALGRLASGPVDVVVTDLQMPGMNGLEFIREIERRRLDVQVLMITAHASVSSAVEAMRHGAFDYIEKPFDAVQLERSVAQACDRQRLYEQEQERGAAVECDDIGSQPPARSPRSVDDRQQPRDAASCGSGSRKLPRPTKPCSSAAKAAPARNSSRRRFTR